MSRQLQSKWLADGAVIASKLDASARQSVLESKLLAVRSGVLAFTTGTSSSDVVTTEVEAAAAIDTPQTDLTTGEGIFVGTVSGATDVKKVLIRAAGSDQGIDDGSGDEIYGSLSEAGGVYTLSYFKGSDDTAYTFASATDLDFYFVEVHDLFTMKSDALLYQAVSGVIDADQSATLSGHLDGAANKHDASEIDVETAGNYTTVADLETNLAAIDSGLGDNDSELQALHSLTGRGALATNLGTFTGSVITDNSTIKTALQELETELETVSSGAATVACEEFVLNGTDITNRYVDLTNVPADAACVELSVFGGLEQRYAVDFAIISDGSENKRLIWDSADANVSTGMEADLASADVLMVRYTY